MIISDKKVNMNEMNNNATNENVNTSLNVSDDELTRLNASHQDDDKKIIIAGLIIENTFTSILDMVFVIIDEFLKSRQGNNAGNGNNGNDVEMSDDNDGDGQLFDTSTKMGKFLGGLRLFLKYFITNPWYSDSKVKEIVLPSLYLSGLSDELIPPKQMRKLFNCAKIKSVLPVMQTFKEGDHNSTWQRAGQKYWDDIVAFLTTTSFMAEQLNAN